MKIFITGASGYIGGSLAEYLRNRGHEISGLVRSQDKADALRQRGINPIMGQLSDAHIVSRAARAADVTINTAEADDQSLVKPRINALAGTGKSLIHTGGSSIVVDDAKGDQAGEIIYNDDSAFTPLHHRVDRISVDRLVRHSGVSQGLRATVISPTMVYGRGRGLKPDSHQIPLLAKKSKQVGAGVHIGKGAAIWSSIYLGDLMTLYELVLEKAPSGAFFFA